MLHEVPRMTGGFSGSGRGVAAPVDVRSVKKIGFLESLSRLFNAIGHQAPIPAPVDEKRAIASEMMKTSIMEEIGMALTEEHHGPGGQASLQREPSLTNGLRAPGIIRMGPARKVENALIGGSLENSLSHRPAGLKVAERLRIQ